MKTVVIFGGSGFVGRHIIRRVAKNDYKIIILHQRQVNEAKLRLLGTAGQIIPISFRSLKQEKIINLIIKADVVINLKTIWDENKVTFKDGILEFNIDLVKIIKKNKKINQFIYFSGIGVDLAINSARSKAIHMSEKYIQENLKNAIIIRPGVIIGGGDQFMKGLLPLFKKSFFIPLFGNGLSKFQPVFIDDVSVAIYKIIETNLLKNHLFEFVGPNIFTYKEFYNYLASCLGKKRVLVPIPFNLIKLGVGILQRTPLSPLNLEQLKLFETDNIASNNYKDLGDLKIKPQDLKEIIKKIININS